MTSDRMSPAQPSTPSSNSRAQVAHALPPPLESEPPAAIDPSSVRPGLPVLPPPTAILEILLLIVLPAALDYFLPAFPSLSEMQPHLFWLPVLLVSLQYGTLSGLLAAGTAIAASSALGWSDQEIGENHFTYLIRVWSQPMLWLMTALVLGQFRMRQIERKQELSRQVAELWSQRQAIADYAGNLRDRCERLERETAMHRSFQSRDVLAVLGRLHNADPETAHASFHDSLKMTFGNCQASIYVRSGDELRLLHSFGWPASSTATSNLPSTHPLADAIMRQEYSPSVLTPGDENILASQGLAATPIRSRDGSRIAGMLKLEAADPAALDSSLIDRLNVLALQVAPLIDAGGRSSTLAATASGPATRPPFEPVPHRQRMWRQVRWQRTQGSSPSQHRPTRTG